MDFIKVDLPYLSIHACSTSRKEIFSDRYTHIQLSVLCTSGFRKIYRLVRWSITLNHNCFCLFCLFWQATWSCFNILVEQKKAKTKYKHDLCFAFVFIVNKLDSFDNPFHKLRLRVWWKVSVIISVHSFSIISENRRKFSYPSLFIRNMNSRLNG